MLYIVIYKFFDRVNKKEYAVGDLYTSNNKQQIQRLLNEGLIDFNGIKPSKNKSFKPSKWN